MASDGDAERATEGEIEAANDGLDQGGSVATTNNLAARFNPGAATSSCEFNSAIN
jgi:hypothetical protein